jgi:hypothetical protein
MWAIKGFKVMMQAQEMAVLTSTVVQKWSEAPE